MIQTEIERLIRAKNDIARSIKNKGVDVPSGTHVDLYSSLIDKIEKGGGGEWHCENPFHVYLSSELTQDTTIRMSIDIDRLIGLEYSLDGNTWTRMTENEIVFRTYNAAHPEYIQNVYFRSKYVAYGTGAVFKCSNNNDNKYLVGTGDLSSLIEGNEGHLYPYCFAYILGNQNNVIYIDDDLLLPEDDELPDNCYYYAFQYASFVTGAQGRVPEIKGTKCGNGSCAYMYYGAKIKSSPDLKFTEIGTSGCTYMFSASTIEETVLMDSLENIAQFGCGNMYSQCKTVNVKNGMKLKAMGTSCYEYMFSGCTSLTSTPEFLFDHSALNSCRYMFQNCSNLTTVHTLNATTLQMYCYQYMFDACTSITTAPELPATNLGNYCYQGMFRGCTGLSKAPHLPATTIGSYSYNNMFQNCKNLSYISVSANRWSSMSNWVSGVASTGEFHKKAGVSITTGTGGIPSGWTVIEDVVN